MFWLGNGVGLDKDEHDMCCGFVVSSLGYEKLPAFIMYVMFVFEYTQYSMCSKLMLLSDNGSGILLITVGAGLSNRTHAGLAYRCYLSN